MKPNSSPPRLACRLARMACANSNGSRHVATCPACQAYFRSVDALDLALRRDAAASAPAPAQPEAFERRILRAVQESRIPAAPARARVWTPVWIGGALAAAAAIAVVFVVPTRTSLPPASNGTQPAVLTQADAAAIVDTVESLSSAFVQDVIPTAGSMVANNPLQQEIGSVYADARSALDFLALNFLPRGTTTASVTPPPRRAG